MTSAPPPRSDGSPVEDAADPVRRERQLAAFAHTAAVIAREPALETVLDRLADEVRAATGMCTCAVVLTDEGGDEFRYAGRSGLPQDYVERLEAARRNGAFMVTSEAVRTRRPIVARGTRDRVLGDPRWAPAYDLLRNVAWDTFVALPMVVRGRAIGALNGFHHVGHVPDDSEVRFLAAMADHAAIAVDNARMFRELQLRAAEEERQRLARDMHDSVTQALFSLSLQARGIELSARERADQELVTELGELRKLAQSALTEMRALIQHRRPAELHEQGLAQGLRRHAAAVAGAAGLSAEVVCDEDPMLDQNLEEDLFRLVQEALNNVVKHARARRVRIELRRGTEEGALVVEVLDDGVGVADAGGSSMHFGMATMQDRARRHGGILTLAAGPGGVGTAVRVVVPGALPPVAGPTR